MDLARADGGWEEEEAFARVEERSDDDDDDEEEDDVSEVNDDEVLTSPEDDSAAAMDLARADGGGVSAAAAAVEDPRLDDDEDEDDDDDEGSLLLPPRPPVASPTRRAMDELDDEDTRLGFSAATQPEEASLTQREASNDSFTQLEDRVEDDETQDGAAAAVRTGGASAVQASQASSQGFMTPPSSPRAAEPAAPPRGRNLLPLTLRFPKGARVQVVGRNNLKRRHDFGTVDAVLTKQVRVRFAATGTRVEETCRYIPENLRRA